MPESGATVPEWISSVGRRIRTRRQQQGWTVQQLADRAHVSRRMLTQIELGQANPSLTTVDRIATALGTDFPGLALMTSPNDPKHATITEPASVWQDPHGSEAVLLGATTSRPRTELWRWALAPGQSYESAADADPTEAVIHVLTGLLTISDADSTVVVPAGASATFTTDGAYAYTNDRDAKVTFVRLFRSL